MTEYIEIRGTRENNLKDEHNINVIGRADHVADLGPEGGGSKGGCVIFEGTPHELMSAPGSLTGQFLAAAAASR